MLTSGRIRKYRQRMEEFFKCACVASCSCQAVVGSINSKFLNVHIGEHCDITTTAE
jgi:hypothetical protein